jgi:hypothetical protein
MRQNAIDRLWEEYLATEDFFEKQKAASLLSTYTNTLRKVLILSCGSFFEYELTEMLKQYVKDKTNNDEQLINFLEKQAIRQKYHTLFDWGAQDKPNEPSKSINKFLSLFGENFKESIKNDLKNNNDINASKDAFLELGHIRNILVHSNFSDYNHELKTPKEIYELYLKANKFIPYIKENLYRDVNN